MSVKGLDLQNLNQDRKSFTAAARSQNFREPLKWVDFQRICHVFPVGAARRRNGQMRAAAVLSRPDLIPLWENPVFATVCICIPISLSISTNMHLYMCILSLIVINFIQHVLSISFTLYFFAYFMTDWPTLSPPQSHLTYLHPISVRYTSRRGLASPCRLDSSLTTLYMYFVGFKLHLIELKFTFMR